MAERARQAVSAPQADGPRQGQSAWERARESLARSRGFRLARVGLILLSALAVFAPLLASDRPLYLRAVHRGDFERARRELVPMTASLAALLAPSASPSARAREAEALEGRLAMLQAALGAEAPGSLEGFDATLDRARMLADEGRVEPGTDAELVGRACALADELEPLRLGLRPARSFPLLAGLTPLEVGLFVLWLLVLLPPLRARLGSVRALGLAALVALLAGLAWSLSVGAGRAFPTGQFKEQMTAGEIEAASAWFAPVPYGFAEQHPEESLRPPTWLRSAELDPAGAYVRGPRAPRPDPVTGFVPRTRAVEVRAGEPALNSPARPWLGTDPNGRDVLARVLQ